MLNGPLEGFCWCNALFDILGDFAKVALTVLYLTVRNVQHVGHSSEGLDYLRFID